MKGENGMFHYKHMMSGQESIVHQLIKEIFDEFIGPDYSQEGVHSFYRYIEPQAILKRQEEGSHNILLAFYEGELAGVMETRHKEHISLLFVKKKFHRRGLAKAFIEKTFREDQVITVNASPYAVPIYEKLFFEKVSGELIKDGITYIPMIRNGSLSMKLSMKSES